ncbi:MAG: hypothetical protein E6J85_07095 [Deltaproteobacteria bacterium]|nr:MAG: hypothetical protein E6J85_07095 [Deltaproteobacteria bacterium]
MREGALARAGIRGQLDGGIEGAGPVGEPRSAEQGFEAFAPFRSGERARRGRLRPRRHGADDREEPLGAADRQLRLTALME